jgi:hypothetical protein
VIAHQIAWTEANAGRARFVYARGNPDWDTAGQSELDQPNRKLADGYRPWMAPFVEAGKIRPMPMLVISAVVTGPAHAIARRWLAGQAREPLHAYTDQLADAATAALTGTPTAGRRPRHAEPRRGRVSLQPVADDGSVLAEGDATVDLLPSQAGRDEHARGRRAELRP